MKKLLLLHIIFFIGCNSNTKDPIIEYQQSLIDDGKTGSNVFKVYKDGEIVYDKVLNSGAVGDRNIDENTIFAIHSMTKTVTTVAAMILHEKGMFQLDDPLHKYLPEFKDVKCKGSEGIYDCENEIKVVDILTHRSGYIYYLDNGTPEPVRSALIEGGMWWNEAFENIGFKNAFQIKMLPEGADPLDARYNVIQWVHRSTRGWSYGSSVIDPRTGEIIKGHVTLGSLRIRQDFMIALGLIEQPFLEDNNKENIALDMALSRIRQLSAHEIGHTLGFAHNFTASTNLRSSVMDYPHPNIKFVNGEISIF